MGNWRGEGRKKGYLFLAALLVAAMIRLEMQFLDPFIFWHQLVFFFLAWWLTFLLARLILPRYWSFWLAVAGLGWLILRFYQRDNGLTVGSWLLLTTLSSRATLLLRRKYG